MSNLASLPHHTRFAICGAGPVGQALALLLHQAGIAAKDILLFDAKTHAQVGQDARSIALSYGSEQILSKLGAKPEKTTAITEIHVSRRRHFGRSFISANDYKLPALGYVARYGDIISPLERALHTASIVTHRPVHVTSIIEHAQYAEIALQDGSRCTADVVIQAEGGTFADQEKRIQHHDYQQTAVIAHVKVERAIAHRAFERFSDQGPIALLPEAEGYALVWCMRPTQATAALNLNDYEFLSALQLAFGDRLGSFLSVSPRVSFPLGLNAQPQASQHIVRIGNAAQTLHPVAGQGLNLGLRDAYVLAQCLNRHSALDASNAAALQEFLDLRKVDRQATIKLTDTMAKIFASSQDGSFVQGLLGMSLCAVDLLPPVKKLLAEQLMFGWR